MRLRVDDDVDILEPLSPGSDDPLPGFPRERGEGDDSPDEHHALFVAPPRDPRARRALSGDGKEDVCVPRLVRLSAECTLSTSGNRHGCAAA